jgi:hypothetical protein
MYRLAINKADIQTNDVFTVNLSLPTKTLFADRKYTLVIDTEGRR